MSTIKLATRQSPLALAQSKIVAAKIEAMTDHSVELVKMVTTGDRQTAWSLEKQGGKGLFTKELEDALLNGAADIAVHSAKDLPGDQPVGLEILGYLPRADPRDVLVVRAGVEHPQTIATSSPRRRQQLAMRYPDAVFTEIRGNVDTRLRKIGQDGVADATVLAAAGLQRLGIGSWLGVEFRVLGLETMVPAVGQAAIAIQTRQGALTELAKCFDIETKRAIDLERAFQRVLEGGCQTALGVHLRTDTLWFYHDQIGLRSRPITEAEIDNPATTASVWLKSFGFFT
jgi:hydroxymethylbilane synthase